MEVRATKQKIWAQWSLVGDALCQCLSRYLLLICKLRAYHSTLCLCVVGVEQRASCSVGLQLDRLTYTMPCWSTKNLQSSSSFCLSPALPSAFSFSPLYSVAFACNIHLLTSLPLHTLFKLPCSSLSFSSSSSHLYSRPLFHSSPFPSSFYLPLCTRLLRRAIASLCNREHLSNDGSLSLSLSTCALFLLKLIESTHLVNLYPPSPHPFEPFKFTSNIFNSRLSYLPTAI